MHHGWGTAQHTRLVSQVESKKEGKDKESIQSGTIQARDGHHFELVCWTGTSKAVQDSQVSACQEAHRMSICISPLNLESSL